MSGKNKILIVDDDMITRNIAKLIFKDNFEVLEAGNGLSALSLLEQHRQDLVFISCDISMPVMDGFTFLREKNKSVYNNGIPVIIITSVGDDRGRQQAISLGAADFVDKKKRPRESLRSGQRTARDTGMNRSTTQIRSIKRGCLTVPSAFQVM